MAQRETSSTTASAISVGPPRLRLRDPEGAADRFVDGGWWPHSLDFNVELPALLAQLDATNYVKVWAVNYNLDVWDRPPHLLVTGGRRVRMGGFHEPAQKTLLSLVDSTGWKHIDLVVIPPDTAPGVAERALDLSGGHDGHRADAIMALAAEK